MLHKVGFSAVHASIVDKDAKNPNFQTLLAVAHKAA
jgi:hypothetical protein